MTRKVFKFISVIGADWHLYRLMKYLGIKKEKVRLKEKGGLSRWLRAVQKKTGLYFIDEIDKFYIKNVLHNRKPRMVMVCNDNGNYYVEPVVIRKPRK